MHLYHALPQEEYIEARGMSFTSLLQHKCTQVDCFFNAKQFISTVQGKLSWENCNKVPYDKRVSFKVLASVFHWVERQFILQVHQHC